METENDGPHVIDVEHPAPKIIGTVPGEGDTDEDPAEPNTPADPDTDNEPDNEPEGDGDNAPGEDAPVEIQL